MATAQASVPALSTPAARATTLGLPPATCEPTPVNSIGASPTSSAPKVARKLPDNYDDLRLPKLQRTRMPAYHTLTTQGLGPYLIL
ncbi:hypothetical protein IWQ60_008267 [Tieghemiomyces parasiticus]|uniref:Uncharacterized protein n=1 Tax=Tieghemiomyces parasiticus TaxID=78921 RepID=A0A9W8DM21_9FUNG|nr:hypothetical protein IWQ60_008267 [Tieghemiomyces parasiticus]